MCFGFGTSYALGNADDLNSETNDVCVLIPYECIPSQWAVEYINEAVDMEILDTEKTYNYTSPITRLEFCELIFEAIKKHSGLGNKLDISFPSPFSDTDSQAVTLMNVAGIINGKSDTIFAPDDFLTREEAATIIVRTVDVLGTPVSTEVYYEFKDLDQISDWAMDSVQKICNFKFMIGVGDNRFAPKDTFTTEQAITTIVRAFKQLKQ